MRYFGGLRRDAKTQPNKFVAKYSPPRTRKVFKFFLAFANLHSNVFWQFQLEQAILFFCNFSFRSFALKLAKGKVFNAFVEWRGETSGVGAVRKFNFEITLIDVP